MSNEVSKEAIRGFLVKCVNQFEHDLLFNHYKIAELENQIKELKEERKALENSIDSIYEFIEELR